MHFGTGRLPWSPYLAYDVVVASVKKGKNVDSTWLKSLAQTGCYPSTHQGQGLWWEMAVNRSHKQWQAADLTLWFSAKSLPTLGHLVTWTLGHLVNGPFKHAPFCNLWPMTTGTAITITMINDQLHIQISTNTCAIHTLGSTLLKGPVHIFGDVES